MSLGTFPTTFPKYFQKVRLSDMANLTIKDIARISGCLLYTSNRLRAFLNPFFICKNICKNGAAAHGFVQQPRFYCLRSI